MIILKKQNKALNSVRDAVSQSMNNFNNAVDENLGTNDLNQPTQEIISKDYEKFQEYFFKPF